MVDPTTHNTTTTACAQHDKAMDGVARRSAACVDEEEEEEEEDDDDDDDTTTTAKQTNTRVEPTRCEVRHDDDEDEDSPSLSFDADSSVRPAKPSAIWAIEARRALVTFAFIAASATAPFMLCCLSSVEPSRIGSERSSVSVNSASGATAAKPSIAAIDARRAPANSCLSSV